MHKQVYREVFDLHAARLAAMRPGLDFIEETVDAMQAIMRNHPGDAFCADMLRAVYGDLERRWEALQGA